jgi:hypothetical protein
VYELVCHACSVYSDANAAGWRAYLVDNPDKNASRELAFYCPSCAQREFGPVGKRRHPRRSER